MTWSRWSHDDCSIMVYPRRRLRSRLAFAALGVASASAVGSLPADARRNAATPNGCSLREVARTTLRDESGRALYIEPSTANASLRGILLAGAPTFRWQGVREVTGAIFGAIVLPDGTTRTIPWPLPSPRNIADIRATLLPDGSWGIVFAELGPGEVIPRNALLRHLWFGRFDDHAWSDLEQLPVPPGAHLLTEQLSPLASRDDALALSVPFTNPDAPPGALVFVREGGHWSASNIGVNGIAYSRPAAGPDRVWNALVIRSDSSASNAPYLYESRRIGERYVWRGIGPLLPEGHGEAHQPEIFAVGNTFAMSWIEMRSSPAEDQGGAPEPANAFGGSASALETGVVVSGRDSNEAAKPDMRVIASGLAGYAAVMSPSGTLIYALQRAGSANSLANVRLIGVRNNSVFDLGSVRTPYDAVFALVAPSDTEIVLSGPRVSSPGTPRVRVVTELIRLRVRCSHRPV